MAPTRKRASPKRESPKPASRKSGIRKPARINQEVVVHACHDCRTVYGTRRQLEHHLQKHERLKERAKAARSNHKCVHCRRRYASDERLQRHINEYHFKETDERHACGRCLLYKLPCLGTDPCKWCKLDGKHAECVIVVPQTVMASTSASAASASASAASVPAAETALDPTPETASPSRVPAANPAPAHSQQEVQIKREKVPEELSAQQGESSSASGKAAPGWSTPRANSPTDAILSLPPRRLPLNGLTIRTRSLTLRNAYPGEVDIRAGSLSWLDFEVAYLKPKGTYSLTLREGDPDLDPARDPFDAIPHDPAQAIAFESMGLLFKEPHVPPLLELHQFALAPAIELLSHLTESYFLKWHKVQPVFHAASWEFTECPMAVLGAMACIGAIFDDDYENVLQAHHISARCVSELNLMAIGRLKSAQDTMYLAAVCLHLTYLLESGDENIQGHAYEARQFLIDRLKSLKLLGAETNVPASVLERPTESEDAQWTAWVIRELEIRVTWAVFELDCNFSLLTNRPCAIDLRDLPSRFPCSDELYDAPDADTWAELRCQPTYRAQGPLVSTVVAATAERTVLSDHMSPWSKRLCTQILARVVSGYIQQAQRDDTARATQYHGLDLGRVTTERTNSLLDSISFLGNYMHDATISKPLSTMDVINFRYIARTAASNTPPSSRTSLRWAQQKLIEKFAEQPYKSRQYVWHAGQMIRIGKIYSRLAPCDNLRIFTAYLTILAFAQYGPRSVKDVEGAEPFPLDAWPYCEDDLENWLQAGGPAQIGPYTRIQPGYRTQRPVLESIKVFSRGENWAMCERYADILVHFHNLDIIV